MKVSAKPISSPSRTEKFPPPLMMRFLRSNVGSKSRGRSRASPMFVRRKNAPIETQEPSSPKVTCIGQVRVRRSSKKSARSPAKQGRRCWLVRRALFFNKKLKPKSIRPVLRKWVCFFRFGYCRKFNGNDDLPDLKPNQRGSYKVDETEDEEQGIDEEERARVKRDTKVIVSSSPPKNALFLTRCRSAPYRFSSLENQIWGPSNFKTGDFEGESKGGFEEIERTLSESQPDSRDSTEESTIDEEINGNCTISKQIEEDSVGALKEGSALPLLLSRCKSEPARTGERLNPGYTH
ncbi:hypothetical protein LguiB_035169 [Lonicera macranthoides]